MSPYNHLNEWDDWEEWERDQFQIYKGPVSRFFGTLEVLGLLVVALVLAGVGWLYDRYLDRGEPGVGGERRRDLPAVGRKADPS